MAVFTLVAEKDERSVRSGTRWTAAEVSSVEMLLGEMAP